eukprot:10359252-Ditylum_brightwellii.AAC.1
MSLPRRRTSSLSSPEMSLSKLASLRQRSPNPKALKPLNCNDRQTKSDSSLPYGVSPKSASIIVPE